MALVTIGDMILAEATGGVTPSVCSAIASSYAESAASGKQDQSAMTAYQPVGNYYSASNPSGFITGVDLTNYATTSYVDSSVSSKQDSSAMSAYALSADVSGCIDTVSSNSASWGGGGNTTFGSSFSGSGTVESPVDLNGYLVVPSPNTANVLYLNTPTNAGVSAVYMGGTRSAWLHPDNLGIYRGDFSYNTSTTVYGGSLKFRSGAYNQTAEISYNSVTSYNSHSANWESAYSLISGVDFSEYATTAYVDSSVSGKQDSSAMSAYALSADVSGCIDTVSAQSANWGGSALALSAGPGIVMYKTGDTLVASIDETVLWEGSARVTSFSSNLSESLHNFKYVDIYVQPNSADVAKRGNQVKRFEVVNSGETAELYFPRSESMENYNAISEIFYVWNYNDGADFTLKNGARWSGDNYVSSVTAYRGMVTKIVGVSRI